MGLDRRSYSGRLFRPRPEVMLEADSNLLIVATPWGPRAMAEKAIQMIADFLQSSRQDVEVTSPFERLTCLSPLANNIRVALRLANDALYNEDNKDEYVGGIEITVIARQQQETVIAQVGQPHVFLDRAGFNLLPLTPQTDLAAEFSTSKSLLAPLPSNMIGSHSTSNVHIQSVHLQKNDALILLSRSLIPPDFFALAKRQRDLDHMTQILSDCDPECPFWLAKFDPT